ncbi:MAG: ubiquinone/menaquinone biosynthesis methyltransferase [Planctomycetales bacterium]|nr:ubiquinone/menaquinone biosynthesis methyltransferase [Planctomycetales bacterium]
MTAAAPGPPARPSPGGRPDHAVAVREMFTAIAPRYDLLNRVLSGGVDLWWRFRTSRAVAREAPPGPVLDSCAGTLDLAVSLARRGRSAVHAADFSRAMLVLGRPKLARLARAPSLAVADALRLPYRDRSLAAVTVGFGVRNLADLAGGLREMARVVRPGGLAAILEFSMPTTPVIGPVYGWYLTRVLPWIGRLVTGHPMDPYGYLAASIRAFPGPPAFADLLRASGFPIVERRPLTFGIASLWLARRG